MHLCFDPDWQASSQTHAQQSDDHQEPREGQTVVLHTRTHQTGPAEEVCGSWGAFPGGLHGFHWYPSVLGHMHLFDWVSSSELFFSMDCGLKYDLGPKIHFIFNAKYSFIFFLWFWADLSPKIGFIFYAKHIFFFWFWDKIWPWPYNKIYLLYAKCNFRFFFHFVLKYDLCIKIGLISLCKTLFYFIFVGGGGGWIEP